MKNKKQYFVIAVIFLFLIIIVTGIIIYLKQHKKEKETIGYGSYFDDDITGEIIICEDGTATYIPKFSSTIKHYGEYELKDNILTMKDHSVYFEFRVEKEKLILKKYQDYGGKIHEYADEEYVYSYNPDLKPNVLRCGGYYAAGTGESVRIDSISNTVIFTLHEASGYRYAIEGKFIIENDVIKIIDDGAENGVSAEFVFEDGNLVLKYYWFEGKYYEFEYGEKVFSFEYY